MIIKKLNCGNKNDSYVTVQLNYDEVRDIANTCYYATEFIPADQTKCGHCRKHDKIFI